jgi:hypothetical protein
MPAGVAKLSLVVLFGGCAALSHSAISIDGANPDTTASISQVSINTERPILLRGVDEKLLPGVHVSSKLRSITYAIPPGSHVFWLSSAPYGLPLIPQYLRCYVMHVTLSAGSSYELRFDAKKDTPVLFHTETPEIEVHGQLVDKPLILERGCQWR